MIPRQAGNSKNNNGIKYTAENISHFQEMSSK